MARTVTVIPGDGVGPEVTEAMQRVVDASGADIAWDEQEAGAEALARRGAPLPQETLESILRNRVAIKGPVTTPVGAGFRSVNVELRVRLDLYANVRPARTLPGVKTRYEDVDLIVIRENTEGLYSGLEHIVVPGVVESLRVITEKGSERIVRFAFETARARGRRKVTAVHKANILKLSDGLFLQVARRVARDYPEIEFEESIVDATAMRLVLEPGRFDVLVMENLFGDILSDLTSGLVGGLGIAPGANIGDGYAVFEAVHGSAPDIAGRGLVNPAALIFSAVQMLRHIEQDEAAERLEDAVCDVLREGTARTRDLGGSAGTEAFVGAICRQMAA
jgi:isocitrate dehydrogenase (NAD+)